MSDILNVIVVYRKWDWPRYSVTLVSRDVWINSNEDELIVSGLPNRY